jgi:hypothetical protein
MDCTKVNPAQACCGIGRRRQFRRYCQPSCDEFQHRIHEQVAEITASAMVKIETEAQVVHA